LVTTLLWAACSVSAFAQQPLVGYIVPEYLAPKFTAPAGAPSSIVIAGPPEAGSRMAVTGRTLFGDTAVAGVSLYVFQTDVNGRYALDVDNRAGELDPRLHGALRTDAQGRYRFETIRPGSYDGFPSHIHYVVKADGYEPLLLVLQFADDPIAKEQAGQPPPDGGWAFENGPCKARPDCILTQPVAFDAQGVAHVVRDIQMVKK
jgi:hypothetical protein